MDSYVQTRIVKLQSLQLVGFQGEDLEEESKLFDKLEQFIHSRKLDQYLVILPGIKPLAAVKFGDLGDIAVGMTTYALPTDEYVMFQFNNQYVGKFWGDVCTDENQIKYNIDLSKPRFEVFRSDLQNKGTVEWYIPTKS